MLHLLEEVTKPKHDEVLIKVCFATPRRSFGGHKVRPLCIYCLLRSQHGLLRRL